MTTCLAIETPNRKSIWLFSDYQLTNSDSDGNPCSTFYQSKLIHSKKWALAGAGIRDSAYTLFTRYLHGHKIKEITKIFGDKRNGDKAIYDAMRTKEFPEISRLNFSISKEDTSLDELYHFLLVGYQSSGPYLARINPLGKVFPSSKDQSLRRISIGSGEEYVTKYIDNKIEGGGVIIEDLDEQKTFDLGYEAMLEAHKDIYTGIDSLIEGPIDIIRVSESGVDLFGDGLLDAMRNASKNYRKEMFNDDLIDS